MRVSLTETESVEPRVAFIEVRVAAGKGWMVGAEPSGQEAKNDPARETTARGERGASYGDGKEE